MGNGANTNSLRISDPGLDDEFVVPSGLGPEGPAKVLFVGRVEPMKGLQVLTAAMRQLRSRAVAELEVLAVLPPEGSPHLEFARAQLAEARDMGATVIEAPGQREVAYRMARSDIVAIPSQVLETGPLVALEAMAAGAWVVASALGGLLERVHAGVGALVDHGSIDAWRDALDAAIVAAPARRASRAPAPVRHAGDVAAEMARIYNELS
jgi:glycosyltransferase involved in cell wall biosynthesis